MNLKITCVYRLLYVCVCLCVCVCVCLSICLLLCIYDYINCKKNNHIYKKEILAVWKFNRHMKQNKHCIIMTSYCLRFPGIFSQLRHVIWIPICDIVLAESVFYLNKDNVTILRQFFIPDLSSFYEYHPSSLITEGTENT